jgi:hypothetical protein
VLLAALLAVQVAAAVEVAKEPELVTEPRPGQEYVLVTSRNNTNTNTNHHKKGKQGEKTVFRLRAVIKGLRSYSFDGIFVPRKIYKKSFCKIIVRFGA